LLQEKEILTALHYFARRCQWPSPHEILEQAGKEVGETDQATKLTNQALNAVRLFGTNSLAARDNLPAITWSALQEWGGWPAWAGLTDDRVDRARYQLKVIIERHLKTGQRGLQLNESTPEGTNTLTSEQKRVERLKRDELANDPDKRKELRDLADRLAKEFGL
jgi:hypothetical protein